LGAAPVAASESDDLWSGHVAGDGALGAGFGVPAVGGCGGRRRCRVIPVTARLAVEGARGHPRTDRDAPAFTNPDGDAVSALCRGLAARVSRGGKTGAGFG
jgi:hypothetical protein